VVQGRRSFYVINGASYFSMQVAAPNSMELLISAVRWQHLIVNDRYSFGVCLDEPKKCHRTV
jgi:hypothetical protein